MRTPAIPYATIAALWFAAVFSPPCRAEEFRRSSLLERTPFAEKRGPSGASGGAYELRGFFGREDDLEVSIRRTDTGESRWVRVGDDDGWRVTDADAEAGTATLVAGGMRLSLRLAREGSRGVFGEEEPAPTATGKRVGAYAMQERLDEEDRRNREAALAGLRTAHPEYFLEPNAMSDEQRRVAANAIEEVNRRLNANRATESHDPGSVVVTGELH